MNIAFVRWYGRYHYMVAYQGGGWLILGNN
jgi:hypothetical protein